MTTYRTTTETALLATASLTAPVLRKVPANTEFRGKVVDDAFIETADLAPTPGFVDIFDARELPDAPLQPQPMIAGDDMTFCAMVTEAARHIGWLRGSGADRDYLLAVAYASSANLTDMGTGEAAGPFRFTAAAWNAAITTGPARDLNLAPEQRLDWNHQPDVAAALAAEAAEDFRKAFGRPPSFPELFFLQRLGDSGLDALKAPRETPCRDAIAGAPPAGSYAATLKAGALTVEQAIAELERQLVAGYAKALEVIDRQPPEIRLVRPDAADPAWLRVARDEMSRGVSERPGEANEERISRYHDSAGVTDNRDETPWCGSFVTFCLKTCGDAAAKASIPSSPAKAISWSTCGRPAGDPPPLGAIVVLRFPDGGEHVGFLVGRPDANHIGVLGGNQGNPGKVSEVNFKAGDVIAIRTLDRPAGEVTVELTVTEAPRPGDELFLQKAPVIMGRLQGDFPAMTPIHAAAILGNIGHECMGFRALHQIGMPPGKGGHGWCQWDGVRREAFLAFAKAQGRDWQEDEVNYAFLVKELRGSENKALQSLLAQSTLEAAVEDFDRRFERSGVKALDRRLRYARLALVAGRGGG